MVTLIIALVTKSHDPLSRLRGTGAAALCSTAFVAPTAQTKSLRATRAGEALLSFPEPRGFKLSLGDFESVRERLRGIPAFLRPLGRCLRICIHQGLPGSPTGHVFNAMSCCGGCFINGAQACTRIRSLEPSCGSHV